MNKKIILSLATVLASTTAFAGGLNTNTNANAAYLRFFAQDANVSLTSLYANPAGSAFLSKGWHFGICDQIAIQQRNVTTSFPYFLQNQREGWVTPVPTESGSYTGQHRYEGKAFAPLVPSIDFSYNSGKKWSINAHLGLVGGGGACEYLDGIGSFESMYASTFAANQAVAAATIGNIIKSSAGIDPNYKYTGYNLNSYMKGNSYIFGLSVGATYKILDNLAVFAGVRGVYATANYNGYVQDATMNFQTAYATGTTEREKAIYNQLKAAGYDTYSYNPGADLSMNCDQTGWGVTPILGIHWSINKHWNVAAKYEFKTRLRMHNTTRMNNYTAAMTEQYLDEAQTQVNPTYSPTLAVFKDGASVADDIPSLLGVGVQYSPIDNVRIGLAYHWMQDSKANKGMTQAVDATGTPMYNADGTATMVEKSSLIDKDTHEILFSAEWKCWKYLTISAGYQRTMYGVSDAYMNDVSFNLTNNSIGCGVRIHPSKLFNIDLGYMHTIYSNRTVSTYAGNKIDTYERKNDVIGVGLNFAW